MRSCVAEAGSGEQAVLETLNGEHSERLVPDIRCGNDTPCPANGCVFAEAFTIWSADLQLGEVNLTPESFEIHDAYARKRSHSNDYSARPEYLLGSDQQFFSPLVRSGLLL